MSIELETYPDASGTAELQAPRSQRRRNRIGRLLLRDKRAFLGLIVLIGLVVTVVLAPQLAPYDPQSQDFSLLQSPSWTHPLGTDDLGRDLLSRLIYGARISLLVGVATVSLSMLVGVILGLIAGYYGRWVDQLIMRYVDLQWAFPEFILVVGLVAILGRGLLPIIVAIALALLDDFARITRGMVLSIREETYIQAARAVGVPDRRILVRHILPNALAPIIVQATVGVSTAILAEAAISYLGFGVDPSTPTWGLILSDARSFFTMAWWLALFPGLAITITVLAINFVGDAVRDLFDVREYQGGSS